MLFWLLIARNDLVLCELTDQHVFFQFGLGLRREIKKKNTKYLQIGRVCVAAVGGNQSPREKRDRETAIEKKRNRDIRKKQSSSIIMASKENAVAVVDPHQLASLIRNKRLDKVKKHHTLQNTFFVISGY